MPITLLLIDEYLEVSKLKIVDSNYFSFLFLFYFSSFSILET